MIDQGITFGSACSGIEAASVAFEPLGWRAAWFSEIDQFARSVLTHHYPEVPNLGDMTTIARRVLVGEVDAPDVLCGGTPCQAFSVAGLRESLNDVRGNLTIKFVELADAIDHVRARAGKPAAAILWENVPGVLSTKDNAFGCFLGGLAGEDGPLEPPEPRPAERKSSRHWKWNGKFGFHCPSWSDAGVVLGPRRAIAWRTLDAQYFGLAQRRRRVFVVASARDGFDPAQVLFEWDGVRRDSPPCREAGEEAAATLDARAEGGGFPGTDGACGGHIQPVAYGGNRTSGPRDVASALSALSAHGGTGRHDFETETFVTHSLRGEGFDASEDGTGRGTPLVPVLAFDTTQVTSMANRSNPKPGDACHPLAAAAHAPAIAFDCKASGQSGFGVGDVASTMRAMGHADSHQNGGGHQAVMHASAVRRLTPRECERLQGFPDDYTLVKHGQRVRPEKLDDDWLKYLSRGNPKGLTREEAAGLAADGPRYKALGNSWAVPCVQWIGRRLIAHQRA